MVEDVMIFTKDWPVLKAFADGIGVAVYAFEGPVLLVLGMDWRIASAIISPGRTCEGVMPSSDAARPALAAVP
ncbi:hypothetical protein LWI28_017394 [Acer negundo]|uniref:Uncharacterized protein n=1 Tax=Acer negundo TaxID=4023 RepID=A0AAD5JJI4_ACENE|nr:hypothetical protein LWI28_017394 [Acer negundo]KAK4860264.1 hypothetical protein QYF36_020230 [Acer negundo]